jgi:hypothetical protein
MVLALPSTRMSLGIGEWYESEVFTVAMPASGGRLCPER